MTFWILMTLAGWLTFLCLRNSNLLLSLGAGIAWFSLMAYNLTNPPTNITAGSIVHEWLTMGFFILGIAVILMWFRTRGRTESVTRVGVEKSETGGSEVVAKTMKVEEVRDDSDAYRQRVRKALHPNRRGKFYK